MLSLHPLKTLLSWKSVNEGRLTWNDINDESQFFVWQKRVKCHENEAWYYED